MKLVSPTEHAIYAVAYVERFHREGADRPDDFTPEGWAVRAADLGISSGEYAVKMHREAIRRRSRS